MAHDIQSLAAFREAITEEIKRLEAAHKIRLGVSLRENREDEPIFSHRGTEKFHAASTMKVPLMIEVFRQAEEGKLSLDDQVTLDPNFKSMIDDSAYEADAGKRLTAKLGTKVSVLELVEECIVVSDNLATNLLMERVRPQRVTATMRSLGAKDSVVLRGVMDEEAYKAGISNLMTPNDLTVILFSIEDGSAANAESCAEMKRILKAQEYRTLIPAGLPEGVEVGNKTGSITGVAHDGALVEAPSGTFALSIMMDGLKDGLRGSAIAPDLTRKIYDLHEQFKAAGVAH